VLDHTRRAGGAEALAGSLAGSLADWRHRLSARPATVLAGAARLDAYLRVPGT
jgi:hypothetical protein